MRKEVLEVDGKRCKFGAIEIGQVILVVICLVLRSSVADCRGELLFRVCSPTMPLRTIPRSN
jgi:hypothetical protein